MLKYILSLFALICFSLSSFSLPLYGIPFELGVNNNSTTTPTSIPQEVLDDFYASYIYDELGRFQGAYIGGISTYASISEIETIVSNSGVALQGTKIFEDYKPKGTRGCKAKEGWICTLEGDVVDL